MDHGGGAVVVHLGDDARLPRRVLHHEVVVDAQNLAGQGLRQFANELDGPRIFVRCSHGLGMSLKFGDERI